ncbi:MAG: L,D-transpeptidase [Candidatus Omnitrophica bacterium]|nr:L,D-transpeptidase [Candidatus Omnitrophota bacterium]MCA9417550.1 L,D-transpeptidase [Candidatus Omnitrophota bacterium]MCA9424233.1 L,D-transpeptidase [Candidatus Omnitrophota bacterium]MCA9429251.1 L,D-transpeptidase [Candidatus Omnitrophota bacterium]MCA9447862.1 L,D-transpeptidase [Candidatus Omnitrophota bacterium]
MRTFFFAFLLFQGLPFPPHECFGKNEAVQVSPGEGDKEKVKASLQKLVDEFDYGPNDHCAIIVVESQRLYLLEGRRVRSVFPVSTSKYGVGGEANSNKTPPGTHRIEEKIGDKAPLGTIFRARGNTGKIAKIYTRPKDLHDDLVTTRILWLKGLEEGINSGKGVDSYKRMIYIHGTPEEGLIGQPASHGCVRLKNSDVVETFSFLSLGSLVDIIK